MLWQISKDVRVAFRKNLYNFTDFMGLYIFRKIDVVALKVASRNVENIEDEDNVLVCMFLHNV